MLSVEQLKIFARETLSIRLEVWVNMPQYFAGSEKWPDGKDKVWCNVAARDFLDSQFKSSVIKGGLCSWYNYDLSVLGGDVKSLIRATPIDKYYQLVLHAAKACKVEIIEYSTAIDYARCGYPIHIIDTKCTHEAIMHPSSYYGGSFSKSSIFIAQHGLHSGIFPLRNEWVFGKVSEQDLIFIRYPRVVIGGMV
jgi:hypothetical protein